MSSRIVVARTGSTAAGWDAGSPQAPTPSGQQHQQQQQYRRIPVMPSQLFQQLAHSQLELLANSLTMPSPASSSFRSSDRVVPGSSGSSKSKIGSMALYLPQENVQTGQLEFLPAVVYPNPNSERVFIASQADSGVAPNIPKTLSKLPGFAHATSLLPGYPMVSSPATPTSSSSGANINNKAAVGVVEEVFCDLRSPGAAAALSVPLFSGPETVGVLLVTPVAATAAAEASETKGRKQQQPSRTFWTQSDRQQVAKAAESLTLALCMDTERTRLQMQNDRVQQELYDSLHQVKNPLQALRTYGKLLQRRVASSNARNANINDNGGDEKYHPSDYDVLELAEHLLEQSDRLVDRLKPVDSIVDSLSGEDDNGDRVRKLLPAAGGALVVQDSAADRRGDNSKCYSPPPAELEEPGNQILDFSHDSGPRAINSRDGSPSGATSFVETVDDEVQWRRQERATSGFLDNRNRIQRTSQGGARRANSQVSFAEQPIAVVDDIVDDNLEMVFVDDVLSSIFSAFHAIAMDRGISFVVEQDESDDLPGVLANPQALQETVSNVLDNAFKYVVLPKPSRSKLMTRNPSPQVRVRLMSMFQNPSSCCSGVTILVEDNGPGIALGERSSVFERGVRGSNTNGIAGTGIGLHIAQTYMRQMGGSIQFVTDPSDAYQGSLDGAVVELKLYRNKKSPTTAF